MKPIEALCGKYNIALCYLFGSRQETGRAILEGKREIPAASEADIDFAVLFRTAPVDPLETYARLSMDLQDLVKPHRADLLFLHEVDHLIQLEAIRGINVYAIDERFRDDYEDRVMMYAADELEIFRRNEKDQLEAFENGYFEFEYKAS
jgi:hypothetical protein